MAEGEASAARKPAFTVGKLILGVSVGTILAGVVLMGIRHLVVIIRGNMSKQPPGGGAPPTT
jgi:hypothetical protein